MPITRHTSFGNTGHGNRGSERDHLQVISSSTCTILLRGKKKSKLYHQNLVKFLSSTLKLLGTFLTNTSFWSAFRQYVSKVTQHSYFLELIQRKQHKIAGYMAKTASVVIYSIIYFDVYYKRNIYIYIYIYIHTHLYVKNTHTCMSRILVYHEFPGSPVVGSPLSLARAQVQPLVRELRPHKLQGTVKKIRIPVYQNLPLPNQIWQSH